MMLSDSITALKGVGEKKKDIFHSYGIDTIEDLLNWFPRKYEDRRNTTDIGVVEAGKDFLICGKVISRRYRGNPYRKNSPLTLLVEDDSGLIEIVFFNGRYIANFFNINSRYSFYGKVSENLGHFQMIHPEFHKEGDAGDIRGILPVYPQINGISQNEIRKLQSMIGDIIDDIPEWLPEALVKKYNLASPAFAIKNIHFPKDSKYVLMSRYRLIFEELLALESGLMYIKNDSVSVGKGIVIDTGDADDFICQLPFKLTSGQKKAWDDIDKDLRSGKAMNRLIQGDVGSGKTAIAEIAMFAAVKSGYQAVMMVPTEILAKQHFESLKMDFRKFGIKVGLLCSSMKSAERNITLDALAKGNIDILVGTHAVIQPGVEFKNLGLVVTDEQHRFGVEQRHRLSSKGDNPNVMVMTATPIPRTLAVIIYGDLDISVIDTMPEGRKKIITKSGHGEDRDHIYDLVKEELKKNKQAYVVAPLIEESEKIDAKSAEELFEELKDRFKQFNVAMIHGSLKQDEKDSIMQKFVSGEIDVLVSTVVIEVGINVANATVMVIENSERFGLAQLHQLRGRVGRGSDQSYCYLILNSDSEIAAERTKIMCESFDGFKIAEEDLRLRGPGEIFGTRQHGLPELHISDIVRHGDVLENAKDAAKDIIDEDPQLKMKKYSELKRRIQKMFGDEIKLEI